MALATSQSREDDLRDDTSQAGKSTWKESLASAIREPAELLDRLGLSQDLLPAARRAAELFPLVVPREFVARMGRGNPDDPLLRQVLPLGEEFDEVDGFSTDPLGEEDATRAPGLLHKYASRALLVTAGTCAINCRFCFRRHFPYDTTPRGLVAWEPAMREIASDERIREVILSGGDPLVLTDESLSRLAIRIAEIEHVRRLRIHTRLPIVIPSRVNDELVDWLRGTRLTPVVVIHANHPAELAAVCGGALERLVDAGIPVLHQAVLMRTINDDAETLVELCERLADLRVLPYYLHQLDPVQGVAHFAVENERALELVQLLRERLSGYAVPRLVREVAGAAHKVELRD